MKIKQFSTVIFQGIKPKKKPKTAKGVTILYKDVYKYNTKSFIESFDLKVEKNHVILYKSVNPETLCDFRTGKIKYEGKVVCPDFNPSIEIECGQGLHLCATPEMTQSFNKGKILKCKVHVKDIVVCPTNIQKVRVKKLEVIGEYRE